MDPCARHLGPGGTHLERASDMPYPRNLVVLQDHAMSAAHGGAGDVCEGHRLDFARLDAVATRMEKRFPAQEEIRPGNQAEALGLAGRLLGQGRAKLARFKADESRGWLDECIANQGW